MKDTVITEVWAQLKTLSTVHPKIPAITTLVGQQLAAHPHSKIIVFTHFRDTSQLMVDHLQQQPGVHPVRFIGQAGKGDDKGLSQKEQSQIIDAFRKGSYNVLVATSVAEEGLDIPQTDLVVFFEPVPSEIRTIQRRGRTGRKMPGKVVIFITKGTPDEGYYWASKRKEKKMRNELEGLRHSLRQAFSTLPSTPTPRSSSTPQKTLEEYQKKNADVTITVDHRESRSTVARRLDQKGVLIATKQLDVGDYILSSRLGVERKSVDDFLASLCDGKLFQQIKYLRDAYSRPLLVLEGEGLLTKRNISSQAIYGCLSSILVDYGIPIISTKDEAETADVLYVMAKREQRSKEKTVSLRGEKHLHTMTMQQQYLIEGLPHISSVLATRLLRHFGSIYALMNATEKDLCEVQGIGPSIARDIHQVLHSEFAEE
jgi:Fanconi anemia group M protein